MASQQGDVRIDGIPDERGRIEMPNLNSRTSSIPAEAKQIMLSTLFSGVNDIQRDEDLSVHSAITEYCLSLWGLTGDDGAIKVDGSGDRGVDWYRIEDGSADIWQFKCVSENNEGAYGKIANPGDLSDLRRIITYVNNCSNPMIEQNRNAHRFQNNLLLALRAASTNESSFHININYVVTKNGFSKQALEEMMTSRDVV